VPLDLDVVRSPGLQVPACLAEWPPRWPRWRATVDGTGARRIAPPKAARLGCAELTDNSRSELTALEALLVIERCS
jgi:hypothetical protein